MKGVLKALFDYQKFEQNEELASVIKDTDQRYTRKTNISKIVPLSDDLLNMVAGGAGNTDTTDTEHNKLEEEDK